jgi:four helix bundle protein
MRGKEFVRFLGIAAGSLAEVDTLLGIAVRAELATQEWYDGLYPIYLSASKATAGLLKAVRARM